MIISSLKFCVTGADSLRFEVFQERFKNLPISAHFHFNKDYSTVCTSIVKTNINLNTDCFMIFEDDACPITADYLEQIKQIEKQLLEINIHWDVLYLGAHLLGCNGEVLSRNLLHKVQPYCTHAVLYRSSAYQTLMNLKDSYPTVDAHCWDEMVCNSNLVKLVVNPMIITQLDCRFSLQENLFVHDIMDKSYKDVRKKLECETSY